MDGVNAAKISYAKDEPLFSREITPYVNTPLMNSLSY